MLIGRTHSDQLYGGDHDDVLDGGSGADLLIGGLGRDRADYGSAEEGLTINLAYASANTGNALGDTYLAIEDLGGSEYADRIVGNGLGNALFGRGGNDMISALAGNDSLYGGAGDDVLIGQEGADHLDGGAGADLLVGGAGADHFIFRTGNGADVIADFDRSEDRIELSVTSQDLLFSQARQQGDDVVLDFAQGDSLRVTNTTLDDLTDAFIFL